MCHIYISGSPVSTHPNRAQDVADHKWKETQCSEVVHQAGLSDNRWNVECLPGLSTQRECPCMRVLHCALCLMMDPSCRGIDDALWNMLEDDYNGEWLSVSLSSVSACPLPLLAPLFYFLPFLLSLLLFSTWGQVSLCLRCQGCQSPTQWVRGNCCQGNRAIRLLGTWSCAHNSHFVA